MMLNFANYGRLLKKGIYVIGSFSCGTKDKARIRELSAAHTKSI
jgi:hypothetical protein